MKHVMRHFFILASLAISLPFSAQAGSLNLGVTPCSNVLKQRSNAWIQQYTETNGNTPLEQVKAILRYEHCYSQHLNELHDKINKSNRFPMMGAMGNFRDMEGALSEFNQIAIRSCGQSGERVRVQRAFGYLYQLQFRHYFLMGYQEPSKNEPVSPKKLAQIKRQWQSLLAKETPEDAALITSRFDKLRQLAVEDNNVPEYRVYEYAVMLLSKSGPIVFGQPPF